MRSSSIGQRREDHAESLAIVNGRRYENDRNHFGAETSQGSSRKGRAHLLLAQHKDRAVTAVHEWDRNASGPRNHNNSFPPPGNEGQNRTVKADRSEATQSVRIEAMALRTTNLKTQSSMGDSCYDDRKNVFKSGLHVCADGVVIIPERDESEYTDQIPQQRIRVADRNEPDGPMKKYADKIKILRMQVGSVLEDRAMQIFVVCLIAANALVMGLGTFAFVKQNPSVNGTFEAIDQVFLICFTIELGMQFFYHGWRLFLNGWLLFDFLIISVSWSLNQVQYGRAFRIFRALRLITRVEVMKNLVIALVAVMPRMCGIVMLQYLISYIFAVMYTQLWKDLSVRGLTDDNYFGRLDATFLTLFQMMTLDSWASIARQVMAVDSWAWLPICSYVIVTGFIVVHLLIAVICDAIATLNDEETTSASERAEEDSLSTAVPDIREQLLALEASVTELTMMQEETMENLKMLTRQMKWSRMNQRKKDIFREAAETAKKRR